MELGNLNACVAVCICCQPFRLPTIALLPTAPIGHPAALLTFLQANPSPCLKSIKPHRDTLSEQRL